MKKRNKIKGSGRSGNYGHGSAFGSNGGSAAAMEGSRLLDKIEYYLEYSDIQKDVYENSLTEKSFRKLFKSLEDLMDVLGLLNERILSLKSKSIELDFVKHKMNKTIDMFLKYPESWMLEKNISLILKAMHDGYSEMKAIYTE